MPSNRGDNTRFEAAWILRSPYLESGPKSDDEHSFISFDPSKKPYSASSLPPNGQLRKGKQEPLGLRFLLPSSRAEDIQESEDKFSHGE